MPRPALPPAPPSTHPLDQAGSKPNNPNQSQTISWSFNHDRPSIQFLLLPANWEGKAKGGGEGEERGREAGREWIIPIRLSVQINQNSMKRNWMKRTWQIGQHHFVWSLASWRGAIYRLKRPTPQPPPPSPSLNGCRFRLPVWPLPRPRPHRDSKQQRSIDWVFQPATLHCPLPATRNRSIVPESRLFSNWFTSEKLAPKPEPMMDRVQPPSDCLLSGSAPALPPPPPPPPPHDPLTLTLHISLCNWFKILLKIELVAQSAHSTPTNFYKFRSSGFSSTNS